MAAFIVVLALSLPICLKLGRRWGVLVWPGEVVLMALLVGTGSRGGVLALICGLAIGGGLDWLSGRGLRGWRPWMAVVLAILFGVGIGLAAFPKGFRLGSIDVSPEASAGRRLEVWATVPAMLAAAPDGWGLGKSSEAYEQWFEPVGESIQLKHLLSSHLTWLVEFGWPLRWLYLFLWMAVLILLLPSRAFPFSSWGMAVWTAFFVALFYNAAGKWWNWPLPLLWLAIVLILRCRQGAWPRWPYWAAFAVLAGILVASPFVIFGIHPSSIPVRAWDGGNIVTIGTGKPTVAILSPSKDVLGDFYGHEIRKEWSKSAHPAGSVIIVTEPDARARDKLSDCSLDLISGGDERALYKWRLDFTPKFESKLLLINCRAPIDDWVKVFSRVVYCRGVFFGDPNYPDWKEYSEKNSTVSINNVPECEAYIADWWAFLGKTAGK